MSEPGPARVVITGGAGNLGQKLVAHLSGLDWCDEIILIDRIEAPGTAKSRSVVADLTDAFDDRWIEPLRSADAVVHLAADNPYPDASWSEACRSFDMTANLLAQRPNQARRFVFASSNHTMGGYKEIGVDAGMLTPTMPPSPGTRFHTQAGFVQDRGYAVAKLMGERAVAAASAASGGRLTGVNLRIGWCQPGENDPISITGDGLPFALDRPSYEGAERDLVWFRSMWLSNGDLLRAVTSALVADAAGWPAPSVTVNAMSNNSGMPWSRKEAIDFIGFESLDNVWDELRGRVPLPPGI